MQNSTTETQAKRNHQFDLHSSTTLTDSNKLRPLKLIQKPTTDLATHADSNHHFKPNKHQFNPTKTIEWKEKKIERGETEK